MSMQAAESHDPHHDPEEATRWFNQWHVYRSIVDANWMAHREMFNAVRAWVLTRYPGPFTLRHVAFFGRTLAEYSRVTRELAGSGLFQVRQPETSPIGIQGHPRGRDFLEKPDQLRARDAQL